MIKILFSADALRILFLVSLLFCLIFIFLSFFDIDLAAKNVSRLSSPDNSTIIAAGCILLVGLLAAVIEKLILIQSKKTPAQDKSEAIFLSSILTFIEPSTKLEATYGSILTKKHNLLVATVENILANQQWEELIGLKIRIREYFEWSGQYCDGIKFGEAYKQALQALDKPWEAIWSRIKDISYMKILSGMHEEARKDLRHIISIDLMSFPEGYQRAEALFYCLRYIGISYQREGDTPDYKKANENFTEALKIVRNIASDYPEKALPLQARITRNLGNLLESQGDHIEAQMRYAECLSIFEKLEDEEHIGITHLHIAQSIISSGDNIGTAKVHLERVRLIAKRIGWSGGESAGLINQARLDIALAEASSNREEEHALLQQAKSNLLAAQEMLKHTDKHYWIGRTHEILNSVEKTLKADRVEST